MVISNRKWPFVTITCPSFFPLFFLLNYSVYFFFSFIYFNTFKHPIQISDDMMPWGANDHDLTNLQFKNEKNSSTKKKFNLVTLIKENIRHFFSWHCIIISLINLIFMWKSSGLFHLHNNHHPNRPRNTTWNIMKKIKKCDLCHMSHCLMFYVCGFSDDNFFYRKKQHIRGVLNKLVIYISAPHENTERNKKWIVIISFFLFLTWRSLGIAFNLEMFFSFNNIILCHAIKWCDDYRCLWWL